MPGLPLAQTWIASAPGGVDIMTIPALAMTFDAAVLGAGHVAGFFGPGPFVPYWPGGITAADNHRSVFADETERSDA